MGFIQLKWVLSKIKFTPLHPQWFAFVNEKTALVEICRDLSGLVVDIGCADGKPRCYLSADARYIGIDYFMTANAWYRTEPDIFSDAAALPVRGGSVDHFLLLDVLEHLPHPDLCLAEIHRCLKPNGSLTIQVPFLYPVHDAPLDFHRWTRFGLAKAAENHGYVVQKVMLLGHPLETAVLNLNIALSKVVLNWIGRKHILSLFILILPFIIVATNLFAWGTSKFSEADEMMPYGYRMVWTKTER